MKEPMKKAPLCPQMYQGWGGSCRGRMGVVGHVGWGGRGGSCWGGMGHEIHRWGRVGHVGVGGVGRVMEGWDGVRFFHEIHRWGGGVGWVR